MKETDCRTTIEREFVKRWGGRPVTEVTIQEVASAVRAIVASRVDRLSGPQTKVGSVALWQLPLIDLVDFLVFAASFTVRKIDWRGSRLTIKTDGRITA